MGMKRQICAMTSMRWKEKESLTISHLFLNHTQNSLDLVDLIRCVVKMSAIRLRSLRMPLPLVTWLTIFLMADLKGITTRRESKKGKERAKICWVEALTTQWRTCWTTYIEERADRSKEMHLYTL